MIGHDAQQPNAPDHLDKLLLGDGGLNILQSLENSVLNHAPLLCLLRKELAAESQSDDNLVVVAKVVTLEIEILGIVE